MIWVHYFESFLYYRKSQITFMLGIKQFNVKVVIIKSKVKLILKIDLEISM